MIRAHYHFLIIFSILTSTLSACSTSTALLPVNNSQILISGMSFGQSFTADHMGMSGISVMLAPSDSPGSGSLLFHLRSSPQSINDLALARLPLSEISHQNYYKFDFTPQSDSQRKDYFLQVEIEGEGQVLIFTAPPDSYLDGALYVNQIPQEAQLGFRLEYDRKAFLPGLTKEVFNWIGVIAVGLFAFILPGWALFSLLWRGWDELPWGSKLGLSGGLSLALYPLFLLWTNLVGLHLGSIYAWLPPLAGLLVLGWKNRNIILHMRFTLKQKNSLRSRIKRITAEIVLADITLIAILGLVIISRLWVVHSLDVPLFGDSYQHTMITQLIIDHGGLFNSWEPYADLITFTYHYGFHSTAAVFHWITGASTISSMLWTGQLINILAIMGLYPLALKITENRWAGVIAMLVAGLISSMPMTYINWGRYTQLAGQVILPVAIWTAWTILNRPLPTLQNDLRVGELVNWRNLSFDFGSLAIVWLALGGVALTHYRILILVILFFPAYVLLGFSRKDFIALLGRIAWIGIGGIILFAPWFIHVFGGKILSIFATQITTFPTAISTATEQFNSITDFLSYLPLSIWILFFFSIGWGLWKRKKDLAIFTLWWFFIVLATNPNWIGLPGRGAITNFAILIALYIPAGVSVGSATEWILQNTKQTGILDNSTNKSNISSLLLPIMALVVICIIGVWELPNRIKDLDIPTYALVTRPDMRAMTWIRSNTAPDSRFLINSFSAYGNSALVGSDAGWWIPLLALRQSTVPPLTYAAELGITPDYGQKVKAFHDQIKAEGIMTPEALELMKEQGITHIYIGQRHGHVNYSGSDVLNPQLLIMDQHFRLVYHEDRVWLFQVQY